MNPQIQFLLEKAIQSIAVSSFDTAKLYLNQAIKLAPKNSEVNRLVGVLAVFRGNQNEAMQYFDKAIDLNPRNSSAITNKASLLSELGKFEEAIQFFHKAMELDKGNYEAPNNLGNTLQDLKRFDEAIAWYAKAIQIRPNYAEAYSNLGNAFNELKRHEEAITSYEKAIQLKPNYTDAYSNLGNAHHELKHFDIAVANYRKAISLSPNSGETYSRLGKLINDYGDVDQARTFFLEAITVSPNYPEGHLNLAYSYFEKFEFDRGWQEYEWRKKTKDQKFLQQLNTKPAWNGDNDQGSLLIWGEQGIGDQILHGSILPDLSNFSGRVTVALDRKLLPAFERSFPKYQFIANSPNLDQSPFDQQISIASLGKIFRRDLSNFKKNRSYLKADQDKKNRIIDMLPKNTIVCGISWKSVNAKVGENKSIRLDDLAPILKMQKLYSVNLQYGDVEAEIEASNQLHGIGIDPFRSIDKYDDIDGLLALIDSCSYVITTSNSTAHLSGALGKETLLLLPFSVGKFWYWQHQDRRSIWYPSVRIFQQQQDGDWSQPIKEIQTFLEEKIAI